MTSETPAGKGVRMPRSVEDLNVVWEWDDAEGMQVRLAGYQPRDEYLRDRAERIGQLSEALALHQGVDLFEIGSGEGVMARELAPRVNSLLCADVSQSFLDKTRATCAGVPNVEYHHIRNDYLAGLPDASFDAGFALNVFIHLNAFEVFLYLREIRRVLRPGGRFLFNYLDFGDVTRPQFHEYVASYPGAHPVAVKGFMSWLGSDVVGKLAAEAGLTPVPGSLVDQGGVCFLTLRRDEEEGASA
ncbi:MULTISPECIES: class I SAM-dependent methyltransferase [Streptomyces]|uniref:class I SAM-dependent methyltransferase n=1 Tax=Streptomyces TaxID=1883 RepID=UPI00163C7026|nr:MULTISPECIES: class I SAM-dependent methyltransferase [Streptomyces]MBC2875778.1 class I SAM-dependent methyltransferase [Streptomyces sp. TYQ1024]UBI37630.1 class I SAM-dependent methyltransferase [Streptomyces mobaraensis]UKW30217.1 class I SAM-dependent methyltransferase [Streptomyces sp. TYQ1024]